MRAVGPLRLPFGKKDSMEREKGKFRQQLHFLDGDRVLRNGNGVFKIDSDLF